MSTCPGKWRVHSKSIMQADSLLHSSVSLSQLMELKLTVDGLEKERDFYFSKLRDIELICQEHESENNPILSKIIDILYATEVSGHRRSLHTCPMPPVKPGSAFWSLHVLAIRQQHSRPHNPCCSDIRLINLRYYLQVLSP